MNDAHDIDDCVKEMPTQKPHPSMRVFYGAVTAAVCIVLMHVGRWALNWLDTQGLAMSLWAASALVAVWTFILWDET